MTALDTSFRYGENHESSSPNDYDLADESQLDCESTSNLAVKRNRAGDSSINNLTSRLGTRLPSLSRKWRHKRAGNPAAIDDCSAEPKLSRANSTRAPSLAGSCMEAMEPQDPQLPPTPARSTFDDEAGGSNISAIDVKKANAPRKSEEYEAKASTPLLPPIMVQLPLHIKDVPFQSPLQSPTIAQSPTSADYESALSFNISGHNMQHPGLPSPPLSTRPSISSFQRGLSQLPTSEIPSMLSNDPCDEWSNRLGHANFTINPEPYLPESFDVTACKRLRSDWDLARCNYLKYLARIDEHYGATSKIFRLTEEKWAGIDTLWRRNTELSFSRTAENGYEAELSRSQSSIAEPTPTMKLPALNGPRSEGKFPELGDEAIVGPMEQVASQLQRRPSRKVGFFKFLQGVIPSTGSFSRSVRSRSVSPWTTCKYRNHNEVIFTASSKLIGFSIFHYPWIEPYDWRWRYTTINIAPASDDQSSFVKIINFFAYRHSLTLPFVTFYMANSTGVSPGELWYGPTVWVGVHRRTYRFRHEKIEKNDTP